MLRTIFLVAIFFSSEAFAQSSIRVNTTQNPVDEDFSGVELVDHFSEGGSIKLYQEDGTRYGRIEPLLLGGEGGYFALDAQNGAIGFEIVGGSGAAGVRVNIGTFGTQQSIFDSGLGGSDSVRLPIDAIESSEMLNEPGVANAFNGSPVNTPQGGNVTLVRSIVAPTAGFVVAIGTLETALTHTNGSTKTVQLSVSRDCDASPSAPGSQQTNVSVPASAPSGTYRFANTVHGLFSVNAGATTFCIFVLGTSDTQVDDQNLTLMYFPTSYGTVQSNETPVGLSSALGESNETAEEPLSETDIALARELSILDNEARMAREIRIMREKLDALEQQMQLNRNEPQTDQG